MIKSSTEILTLANAASASPEMSYAPVWISTDKRQVDVTKTTLKYAQVGGPTRADRIGNALGPIFMVEFVDIPADIYIKVWGLDNDDDNAAIYPSNYLILFPKLEVWLNKFEFTDIDGAIITAPTTYTIHGHRKRQFPATF